MKEKILKLVKGTAEDVEVAIVLSLTHLTHEEIQKIFRNIAIESDICPPIMFRSRDLIYRSCPNRIIKTLVSYSFLQQLQYRLITINNE